ncbi:MAG: radical SAM protein, partial [Desulfovibrio sp.]|nr:radical SAM protein [Desulfovibrio sp.]
DALYALPFTRKAHPCYQKPIPAALMLKTSLTSHRGCGGGCSFCSLALHQGRTISSRSAKSLLAEAKDLVKLYPRSRRQEGLAISDVGGPTANMWMGKCTARPEHNCQRVSCCYPKPCPFFHTPQAEHISLLRQIKKVQGVRSVRVASGIRPDLALKDQESLLTYIREFTGGQLKLAPEHSEARVLKLMRKPPLEVFERFLAIFQEESHKLGRKQYIVPYLMSAFPGCNDEDMKKLVAWLKKRHWSPKQTQCFIPTPGTVATAMFYCGENEEGEKIAVARSDGERLKQHRLLVGPGGARFRKAKQEK